MHFAITKLRRIMIGACAAAVLLLDAGVLSQAAEVSDTQAIVSATRATLPTCPGPTRKIPNRAVRVSGDYATVDWACSMVAGSAALQKIAGNWSILALSTDQLTSTQLVSLGVAQDATAQLAVSSDLMTARSESTTSQGLQLIPFALVAVSQPSGELALLPSGKFGLSGQTRPTVGLATRIQVLPLNIHTTRIWTDTIDGVHWIHAAVTVANLTGTPWVLHPADFLIRLSRRVTPAIAALMTTNAKTIAIAETAAAAQAAPLHHRPSLFGSSRASVDPKEDLGHLGFLIARESRSDGNENADSRVIVSSVIGRFPIENDDTWSVGLR